ncbi:MAG: histidinol-phosphatase [Oscillospiraceae bacterium]|nr:histidinol-phosphatase [Oscillospiraceae bacterium]
MKLLQNLHTHSLYCDGTLSLEDMVLAAIRKGCGSLGFSGHSFASFDYGYCMTLENTEIYFSELKALREKYASQIELFIGIEQEYLADNVEAKLDYSLGSVHFIMKNNQYLSIDGDADELVDSVETHYGGNYYEMVEDYYKTVANVIKKTKADIVAHFDIVSKFNDNGSLFDENHPLYMEAALTAMDEILKDHKLFEVNTRIMFKGGKLEPYPSVFLLGELFSRGGEVILSSDSHEAESICYKYDEMEELLEHIGFRYIKQLTKNGFIDVALG